MLRKTSGTFARSDGIGVEFRGIGFRADVEVEGLGKVFRVWV